MPDFFGEKSKPPVPPFIPTGSSNDPHRSESNPLESGADLQRRLVELEKRLQEEKEKVLLANLRSQEEATYAAKVETTIKDVQEKLRRDRREAEMEEGRLKLEGRIRELETRLVQERETWVATLQEQVRAREGQDKELETHFVGRIEEMERRWLEEKAHWQKLFMAKDEEIRNLKAQTERLRTLEIDLQKSLQEKKFSEDKAEQLAPLQARLNALEEKEREMFQIKAELMLAKEQAQNLRSSSREREERLFSENERLHHEVQSIAQRIRLETENEIKRYKNELSMAGATVLKMRAVAGALERQRATLKSHLDQMSRHAREIEHERAKAQAALLTMEQRWKENELKIRKETEAATRARVADEVRREMEDGWHAQETIVRKELEEANAELSQRLEGKIQQLTGQVESLEAKLKSKNDALIHVQEKMASLEQEKTRHEVQTVRLTSESHSRVDAALQEKRKAEEALAQFRGQLEAAQGKADAARRDMERISKELEESREELQVSRKEQGDAAKELEGARKELENSREERERTTRVLENAKNDVLRARADLREAEAKAASGTFSPADVEKRFEEERKQLEASWLQEKAELEKGTAQLKEQLENFSAVAKQNAEAETQALKARIRLLEEEIEEYRKPKSGILSKLIGQSKPKPPMPPQPPKPPTADTTPPATPSL